MPPCVHGFSHGWRSVSVMPRTKAERINLMVVDLYHRRCRDELRRRGNVRHPRHYPQSDAGDESSRLSLRRFVAGNAADVGLLWARIISRRTRTSERRSGTFLASRGPILPRLSRSTSSRIATYHEAFAGAPVPRHGRQKLGRRRYSNSGNLIKEQLGGKV